MALGPFENVRARFEARQTPLADRQPLRQHLAIVHVYDSIARPAVQASDTPEIFASPLW